jgi:hypothetical protein
MKFFFVSYIFLVSVLFADDNYRNVLKLAGFSSDEAKNIHCKGSGTGFAITSNGHIITANHVIKDSKLVRVTFKNGQSFNAEVLRREPSIDLAVLKVDTKVENYLKVARRTSGLGDDVYTIGYPDPLQLGSNQKFTKGSISSITGVKDDSFFYQISVPVQPGNSGGPLVCDETGDVTGIIIWRFSNKDEDILGYSPQLINYALKSAFISPVLDSLEIYADPDYEKKSTGNQRKKQVVDSVCLITSWIESNLPEKESDKIPPVITLKGDNPITLEKGFSDYSDPGAFSDGGESVTRTGEINFNKVGVYEVKYSAEDKAGNIGSAIREVKVVDTTPPIITIRGENPLSLKIGEKYFEYGAISDGGEHVKMEGVVNIFKSGVYQITYSSVDESSNLSKVHRTVYVLPQSEDLGDKTKDLSQDSVTLVVNVPENNHGGTIGAAIALGSYKLSVNLDGRLLGYIQSGSKSGSFSFKGSGERMVKVTLDQKAFLGLTNTQKIIYSELYNFKEGRNVITISGNLFLR